MTSIRRNHDGYILLEVLVTIVILGGVGSLAGPLVGAVILTAIEETTRARFGGSGRGTDLIIYALLIIIVAVFYPAGVVGWWRDLERRWFGAPPRANASPARADR